MWVMVMFYLCVYTLLSLPCCYYSCCYYILYFNLLSPITKLRLRLIVITYSPVLVASS